MASITSQTNGENAYAFGPRLQLAALGLAAGGVHLAMAPIHAPGSTVEAAGFTIVGWLQILLAFTLVLRPSRSLLAATIAVNAAVIIAYVLSRTTGLPLGTHPGERDSAELADVMTAAFEALLVAGAALLLARPGLAAARGGDGRPSFEYMAITSALPLLVLFATSAVIADPDLVEHGHGGAAASLVSSSGHNHGAAPMSDTELASLAESRCDLAFNPAAYWRETTLAGIDTIMGGEASVIGHNASAGVQGSPELDAIVSKQMTSKGELGDAAMVVALSEASDEVYENWLRWLGASGLANHAHGGNELAPDDNQGMGGHLGPQPWHAMTDPAQCEALARELALARDTALTYPTVADAKKAGWVQVTPYVPGIAAHFMNFKLVDGTFDIEQPEMLLYDGTGDDAHVIGLSYYLLHAGPAEPTQGFAGPNDHFHRHDGLCVNETGVIGDSTTTEEECAARGGRKADGQAGWMNHVWIVPGCQSPWGVFSGASPLLDKTLFANAGKDGGGCAGSGVRDRYNLDPGAEENTPTNVGGSQELVTGG